MPIFSHSCWRGGRGCGLSLLPLLPAPALRPLLVAGCFLCFLLHGFHPLYGFGFVDAREQRLRLA